MPRFRTLRSIVLILVAVVFLLGTGFAAGVLAVHTDASTAAPAQQPTSVASTFNVFWQAWDLVHQHYVEQSSINDTTLTHGAISGMVDALGDEGHSRFLTADQLQAEQDALSGHLEGIGVEVTLRDGHPTVIAPIPDSPAQKAGIRAGDVIVQVNGQDVSASSLDQVVTLVRGPAGTPVKLGVIHPGDSQVTDITIVRAEISVPSVTWIMVPGTKVAHVLVSQFAEHATDQLVSALNDAKTAGATAMVLDLRNDPGGLVDEAVGVASQFLTQGNVYIQRDAQGHETAVAVRSGAVAPSMPMVVLVNEGTASSAEIVAGAIQDHQRAKLIGKTTFGTGTVLSTYKLSDGSALLLGTEEWLTPNGHQIWHHGITPDITVALPDGVSPLTPIVEKGMTTDQVRASNDSQLLRALQELGQPLQPLQAAERSTSAVLGPRSNPARLPRGAIACR